MTLTIIVSERISPYPPVAPWPLVYEIEFEHEFEYGDGVPGVSERYHDEILQRVAEERYREIAVNEFERAAAVRELIVEKIKNGLELHLAIVGPAEIAMDWREP
jgi:hypothetical protein